MENEERKPSATYMDTVEKLEKIREIVHAIQKTYIGPNPDVMRVELEKILVQIKDLTWQTLQYINGLD